MEYGGAINPVMNRDDRRENMFRDDEDRRRFLTTLGEACARTEWQAHAYGLMGNHLPVPSTADRFSPGAGNAPSEPGSKNEIALGVYPKRFNLRLQSLGGIFSCFNARRRLWSRPSVKKQFPISHLRLNHDMRFNS